MNRETYYRSKLPVKLVLLFLANLLLVAALEILLLYRVPVPLTGDSLAEFDNVYEHCTILQEHQKGHLRCYLVQTETGEIHLIPVKSNGLIFTRGKLYEDQIVTIPEDIPETTYDIKIGIRTSTVTISPEPLPWMEAQAPQTLYIGISYASHGSAQETAVLYFVLGAVLTFLELAVVQLIKGH